MGYEFQYGGGEVYAAFQPGTNLTFDGFNASYKYGGSVFGGIRWIQAYYNLNFGQWRFYKIDWIDPEEFGDANSKFKYKSSTIGIRFNFESNGRNYSCHHLIFGRIYENITEGIGTDENNFLAYYTDPDISKYSNPKAYYRIKGFLIEWNKAHNFRAYVKYYPNYPISGLKIYKQSGLRGEGKKYIFLEFGFTRQIKAFY